jgi:hypothetical protein
MTAAGIMRQIDERLSGRRARAFTESPYDPYGPGQGPIDKSGPGLGPFPLSPAR